MIKIKQTTPRDGKALVECILLTDKIYSVGRKNMDLSFPDDSSISRTHAQLNVDYPMANVTSDMLTPSVIVTDLGSKFGTFVNNGITQKTPIAMRDPVTLAPNDRFRFGYQWNEFRVEYTPLVVTSSTLSSENTSQLKKVLCRMGGHLIGEWKESCSYCVMDKVSLTVKVVCAILSAKYIVAPVFFKDYLSAIEASKSSTPKPEDYFPPLAEPSLSSYNSGFQPDPRRPTLFRGKLFLFDSMKSIKKLGVAVKCGGGETGIITAVSPATLKDPSTLILSSTSRPDTDGKLKAALDVYLSAKKRLISDSEIGFAALGCSVQQYCNPYAKRSSVTGPQSLTSQTQLSSAKASVICPESQSQGQSQRVFHTQSQSNRSVINDSVVIEPSPPKTRGPVEVNKPMKFEVPTPIIKEEQQAYSSEQESQTASSSSKSCVRKGKNDAADDGPSGSKRRRDPVVSPAEQQSKRQCQMSPTPKSSLDRSEEKKKNNRTLAAIFGVSDDEDDDDTVMPVSVSSTQRSVVPDSQPTEPKRMTRAVSQKQVNTQATVNTLDTSMLDTQLSVISSADRENDVIPASPEMPGDLEPQRRRVSPRSRPADSSTKRKKPEEPVIVDLEQHGATTKKRRVEVKVDQNEPEASTSIAATETKADIKFNPDAYFWSSGSGGDKNEVIDENDIKPLAYTFVKLLISGPKRPAVTVVQTVGGREVKNFKTFRKVVPLAQNSSVINAEDSMNTTTTARSDRTFNFRPFNTTNFALLDLDEPNLDDDAGPINAPRRRNAPANNNVNFGRGETSDPVEPMDQVEEEDDFSFFERRTSRPNIAGPAPVPMPASSPAKSTRLAPTASSPAKSTRSTTRNTERALSSRSNESAQSSQASSATTRGPRRGRNAPVAAPVPIVSIDDDDEDEPDDEWSFK